LSAILPEHPSASHVSTEVKTSSASEYRVGRRPT